MLNAYNPRFGKLVILFVESFTAQPRGSEYRHSILVEHNLNESLNTSGLNRSLGWRMGLKAMTARFFKLQLDDVHHSTGAWVTRVGTLAFNSRASCDGCLGNRDGREVLYSVP